MRARQHEMLMDHSDTMGDGIGRRIPDAKIAIHPDFSGIRSIHAIEHLHGGGFAGAILADHSMNRARLNSERNPIVGQNLTKPLGHQA